jgi:hypothetical protein
MIDQGICFAIYFVLSIQQLIRNPGFGMRKYSDIYLVSRISHPRTAITLIRQFVLAEMS